MSSRYNVLNQLNLFDSEFDIELLTWSKNAQYWYDGKPTCVQFSENENDGCDRHSYICAAEETVGSLQAQAQFVLTALRTTGGIHTGCPAVAPVIPLNNIYFFPDCIDC